MTHSATLSASRAAAALGLDTRWSTPLQEQYRLLGRLDHEPMDADDIDDPRVQGQVLERSILDGCRRRWQKTHGHPIELIHAAAMPGKPGDPIGGLHLVHPQRPISAHPDGYFLCRECQTAWLVDAKRYGAIADTETAPEALKAQLTIGLECSLADRAALAPYIGDASISNTAIGCVVRFRSFGDRQGIAWVCLDVSIPPEAREELAHRATDWMERYVLPYTDLGWDVPDAEPETLDDYLLLWPDAKPGKIVTASEDLAGLIEEHRSLTDRATELAAHGKQIDADRADLKRAILAHLDGTQDGDAEAIRLADDGLAVLTLKVYGGQSGNRQLSYKVGEYNKKLQRSRK